MNCLTELFFTSQIDVFSSTDIDVSIDKSKFSKYGLTKRAIANKEILKIRRGLYCLNSKYRRRPLNTFAIAQRVVGPSYISLESALSYHGWIPEAVYSCTNVTSNVSKKFDTQVGLFSYAKVPQKILYAEVNRHTENNNAFFMATPIKALADYVYTHKGVCENIKEIAASLRIEPEDISSVSSKEISALMENYKNKRVERFLISWLRELN